MRKTRKERVGTEVRETKKREAGREVRKERRRKKGERKYKRGGGNEERITKVTKVKEINFELN